MSRPDCLDIRSDDAHVVRARRDGGVDDRFLERVDGVYDGAVVAEGGCQLGGVGGIEGDPLHPVTRGVCELLRLGFVRPADHDPPLEELGQELCRPATDRSVASDDEQLLSLTCLWHPWALSLDRTVFGGQELQRPILHPWPCRAMRDKNEERGKQGLSIVVRGP